MANKKGPTKRKGAKKATLDSRKIILIVLVSVLVIAALVYLIGFGGLNTIQDALLKQQQQTTGGSSSGSGSGGSGNVSGGGSSSGEQGAVDENGIGTANAYSNNSVLSGKADFTLPAALDGNCLEVHFVNIGQGDAIVVMLPDGKIFVIDAGSTTSPVADERAKYLAYLSDDLHVDEVDYLLVTHPDADHYNFAGNILDTYDVKNVIYNNYTEKAQYNRFLTKVNDEGATLYPVENAASYESGYFYLRIADETAGYAFDIYAPGKDAFKDVNAISIMCVLSYGGRKVMFTGDAETKTEVWWMGIIGENAPDVDVLKVGHHGSRSCTSTSFVEFIKPEYAVISCDDGKEYGHPHQETMTTLNEYGVVTYRTNRHGDVVLYMDEDGDFMFLPQYKSTVENNSKNRDTKEIFLQPAA